MALVEAWRYGIMILQFTQPRCVIEHQTNIEMYSVSSIFSILMTDS